MAGVVSTGFVKKSSGDILAGMQARLRTTLSNVIDTDPASPLGNIVNTFADELGLVWDAAESVYSGFDRSFAVDDLLEALGELLGLPRGGAKPGQVTCIVNLGAAQTFAPGDLIAHVAGIPTNRWLNRDTIVTTYGGTYSVVFVSETATVSAVAPANTLTTIAQPVSGWTSIYNALDAVAGVDVEAIEVYRARIAGAVGAQGSATQGAIRAKVLAVPGVIDCRVFVNRAGTWVAGLPPKSVRVVVWDGTSPAASNADLAKAIADNVAEGIEMVGATTVNVLDGNDLQPVKFDRAVGVNIYVATNVVSAAGVLITAVQAKIIAAGAALRIGNPVVFRTLEAAPLALAGVDDLANFFIATSAAPTGTTNITVNADQIALFDTSRITVTGNVS